MFIIFHKKFEKNLSKQTNKIKDKFKEKFLLFKNNQFDPVLNNHALSGKLKGIRSINITGDIRVQYKEHKGVIILLNISNHSDLYE